MGVLLALVAGTLAACGSTDDSGSAVSLPDAGTFRDSTVETLRGLHTAHFVVSHPKGGTDLGGGLLLHNAEGDVLLPERAALTADTTLEEFGLSLEMGIIQIAEETYLKDPLSGRWRTVEQGSLPLNFVDMHNSIADALAATTELAIALGRDVDGVSTFLVTGRVVPQAFRGLVPGAPEGEPMTLEAWIGRTDMLPRSVKLTGRLLSEDPADMVRFLDLSRFDEPVTVEPPI
ncbi:MAG: LppX_LprAFG lipoprotein [Dehalococcoidia bacterium]